MSVLNGIPSQYSYWAFNWTGEPMGCTEDEFGPDCNFFFKGGYSVGCQKKSDVLDSPVWYSTIAACPQYPFDASSRLPPVVASNFTWRPKMDTTDPVVQRCWEEMPGGNFCEGLDNETGRPKTSPWKSSSKTCTWQARSAGYLTIEDIFNIEAPMKYPEWCLAQPDNITGYGSGTGIPSNISLFYNLSEIAFPVLQGVTPKLWHDAVAVDQHQLTPEQKEVFQNWAKWSKVRLDAMFAEMDKQAYDKFNKADIRDPNNQTYEDCLSNMDVTTPPCNNGVSAVQRMPSFMVTV